MTFRIPGARTESHLGVFRVERVLGAVLTIGMPGRRISLASMTRLAKIMAARMKLELAPKSTMPPTVTGDPIVGQTLTAAPGTWSERPTTFGYQWQQCDVVGAACTPIADATEPTYAVDAADLDRHCA